MRLNGWGSRFWFAAIVNLLRRDRCLRRLGKTPYIPRFFASLMALYMSANDRGLTGGIITFLLRACSFRLIALIPNGLGITPLPRQGLLCARA